MRGKDSRYTYVIFALACLLVFNIGAFIINRAKTKDYAREDVEIREVFSEELGGVSLVDEESFFIRLFSKSSAAINLFKNQGPGSAKGLDQPEALGFRDRVSNFFKSQLPYINFQKDEGGKEDGEEEGEGEDSLATEDFIIIDRVEEYEDLIIIADTEGNIILENLPKPINVKPLRINREEPYVLVYHTHGTEAFSNLETNIHHTTDRNYNITSIGQEIARVLEAKDHKVEHLASYHDIPSYSQSYSRSLNTVTEKLQANSNLKILLDIHRDGVDLEKPGVRKNIKQYIDKYTSQIDGKDVATFYFVIGPDSPNKEEVLSFAKYFKAIADIVYPDLCTQILIKPVGKYNQFLSDYSMLVEIGANINTMEEALESARLFGEILDLVIENIVE